MSESLTVAADLPQNADYMKTVHTTWIVYTMCFLSLTWAVVQTVRINRMPMDANKVKVQIHVTKLTDQLADIEGQEKLDIP